MNGMHRIVSARQSLVWGGLLLALAMATWLRCQRLAEVSYWFDEGFSIKMARFSFPEIWTHAASDTSPPLFYWLLKVWRWILGASPAAQRSLSVLLGGATVAGTFLFVREAYRDGCSGKSAAADGPALLSAALVALSPPHVYFSSQIRMYALATALAALSSWILMRALRREPPRQMDWAVYTALAVLLVYTHPFGLVTVAVQYLFAVGSLWRGRPGTAQAPPLLRLKPALLSAFCVQALWQFWLPELQHQQFRVRGGYWSRSMRVEEVANTVLEILCAPDWTMSVGFHGISPEYAGVVAGLLAAAVAASLALLQCGRRAADIYLGLSAGLPPAVALAAAAAGVDLFIGRYLLIAHAFVLMSLAVLICRIRPRWLCAGACLGALLLAVFQAHLRYAAWERYAAFPGMRRVVESLDQRRHDAEPVVIGSPLLYPIVLAYADRTDGLYTIGSSHDYPFYWGTAVMTEAEFLPYSELSAGPHQAVWTIDSRRWRRWWDSFSVSMPPGWREVTTIVVPDHYCELVLRKYERVPTRSVRNRRAPGMNDVETE